MQQPIRQHQQPVSPPPSPAGVGLPPGEPGEAPVGAVVLEPGLTADFFISKGAHCNKKFDEWFQPRHLNSIKDTLRILQGQTPNGSLPNGTNLPLPSSVLHTAMSRLTAAIMARPRHVQAIPTLTPLKPQPVSSDEQQCYESWVNQTIDLIQDFDQVMQQALQNALQETVGVLEVMWTQKTEEAGQLVQAPQLDSVSGLPVMDPETGEPIMEPASIQTTERSRGCFELDPCSLFDLAWDPRAKMKFSKASWIRRRKMMTANELLRLEAEGTIQDAQKAIDEAPREDGSMPSMQPGAKDPQAERVRSVTNQNLPVINYEEGIFQVDNFWATVSWRNPETGLWQTGEFNYWVVGGQVLVKLRRSPFAQGKSRGRKPFLTLPLLRLEEGLVGQGIIDLIKDALRDLSTTSSRFNRVATRVAETPTLYGIGSGLNAKSKILQENSMLPVFDVDQVKLAPIPMDVLRALQAHMEFLISQIRQGTPANDQSQGIQEEGVDTATEAQILQAGSSSRFDWMAGVACSVFFPELAEFLQDCHAMYADPADLTYRSSGLDGEAKTLPMDMLLRPWRYVSEAPIEEAQKARRFNQLKSLLTELAQAFVQTPQLFKNADGSTTAVNFVEFIKEKLLPLAGVEADSLFRIIAAIGIDPMTGQPVAAAPGAGGPMPAPAPGPGGQGPMGSGAPAGPGGPPPVAAPGA